MNLGLGKIQIEHRIKCSRRGQKIKAFLSQFSQQPVSKLNKTLSYLTMFSLPNGRRQKVALVALIALVTLTSLFLFNSILGQWVFRTTISSHGTVKALGVGVYWNSNCSVPVSSIEWGLIEPGLASNVTFYIRNEGNYGVTLFLGAENWNPENVSNYLSLRWDYVGQIVNPSETVQVTLSLLASPDVEDIVDFSFDVFISCDA